MSFSNEIKDLRCDLFHAQLKDVAQRVGLRQSYIERFQGWAVDASGENCIVDQKKAFAKRLTHCMEDIANPILDRSCFFGKTLSNLQIKMDLVHYTCLRSFDTIFNDRDESYLQWVDCLYDQGVLTATEALLILTLVKSSIRSLMRSEYDESRFSDLLNRRAGQQAAACFAEGLILTKADFPIRDAEIVLFTEIVHALCKQPCEDRRALFKKFLGGFLETLRSYNVEVKEAYLAYVEEALLEEDKVPEVTRHVVPVPKIKLEANRYWFLRMYDTVVEENRSHFAQEVDRLFDEGFLTHSAANELLDLAESPRRWTPFNLRERLTMLQEKHRWRFDPSELLQPFLAAIER